VVYWYVETWTVPREKLEEHEVAIKKWTDYSIPRLKTKNFWYLWNRQGPIGGRTLRVNARGRARFVC